MMCARHALAPAPPTQVHKQLAFTNHVPSHPHRVGSTAVQSAAAAAAHLNHASATAEA